MTDNQVQPLAFTVADVLQRCAQQEDIILIDIRPADSFEAGYITGSIAICTEDNIAECLQELQLQAQPVILIANDNEAAYISQLQQNGYQVIGYLKNGFANWQMLNEPIDVLIAVEPDELAMDIKFDEKLVLIDVRSEEAYDTIHLNESANIPFSNLNDPGSMANFEEFQNIYIYGSNAYRGITACTLIKKQGIHNLRHLKGGWPAIESLPALFDIIKADTNKKPLENNN
ncbi:rhodanese-like domain-containing protein [Hydrotalea sandarakina]|jgi:rhodanese-related sulfurtransferase|uniref:Rhodanese-related sulfurtransferase n=1 Tax=Hydrotalea sandarakina TaxID=1004304 RepID=A0A2W7RUS4_9BACT|nr:rhodanese-like domain-containing protein [Hydrotalea sandarakina]PZX62310.1 rhodanese-related sulfurtransferase [Hydrotalea sandarakina]